MDRWLSVRKGGEMIYLDNAATSWPKPAGVLEAMTHFLAEEGGSPNRAGHRMAVAAERVVEKVRAKLAALLGIGDPHRIIHTFNCTDAVNMAIKGAVREGDHVITTRLDHNSVLRPLQALADAGVISVTRLPITGAGAVDPDAVKAAITPTTRLIATLHASNVTGAIQPVEVLGAIAREHDLLFLVDAAQSVGVLDIHVGSMQIDLLAFPGHKSLLGPPGTGALYVGPRAKLRPWREGGTGGDSVFPTQPLELPTWLEAGTHNTVGLAGLNAALDGLNPASALHHERLLLEHLAGRLGDDDGIRVMGHVPPSRSVGVMSLTVRDRDPGRVATILDRDYDIAVRPGLHCAPLLHKAIGTFPDGAVRIAPGPTTSIGDIDRLVQALREIAEA